MKKIKFHVFAFISIILFLAFTSDPFEKNKNTQTMTTDARPFALLELFTSQGCSSCPPADKLMAAYAKNKERNIIALAFHVDYWNRLGWKDPFSTTFSSRRQRDYALFIDKSSVYTPQVIINGEKEMIGSDQQKIDVQINKALLQKPSIKILIENIESANNKFIINYSTDKNVKNTTLHAALVQKEALTNIIKGENRGLALANYNIVRELKSYNLPMAATSISFDNLPDLKSQNGRIVLFIQDDASGKILGADQKDF